MTELASFARALLVADTAFPTGAFGFSWGLEELSRAGLVTRQTLPAFTEAQLRGRWADIDRPIAAAAHAARDVAALCVLDREAEALTWPIAAREGARRAGAGLLAAHRNIGTPGLDAYGTALAEGKALGHIAVVEGLVHRAGGLSRDEALTLSGMGMISRLLSAAVRLNLVGAISAQRIAAGLTGAVAELAAQQVSQPPGAFNPLADIAMMRHGQTHGALFSN